MAHFSMVSVNRKIVWKLEQSEGREERRLTISRDILNGERDESERRSSCDGQSTDKTSLDDDEQTNKQ
jgi:hypothetical protein